MAVSIVIVAADVIEDTVGLMRVAVQRLDGLPLDEAEYQPVTFVIRAIIDQGAAESCRGGSLSLASCLCRLMPTSSQESLILEITPLLATHELIYSLKGLAPVTKKIEAGGLTCEDLAYYNNLVSLALKMMLGCKGKLHEVSASDGGSADDASEGPVKKKMKGFMPLAINQGADLVASYGQASFNNVLDLVPITVGYDDVERNQHGMTDGTGWKMTMGKACNVRQAWFAHAKGTIGTNKVLPTMKPKLEAISKAAFAS